MTESMTFPQKHFLITIDTEGDNLWARPNSITTNNSKFIPRFQTLCERYHFKPTYLVNYEMAMCADFQRFAHQVLKQNTGEIGMHLHAWNSPPAFNLTGDDYFHQPFLIEYPEQVMSDKIQYITEILRDTFHGHIVSHRAGRWAIDSNYVRCLRENGYKIDCSITPFVSWEQTLGNPNGKGGPDYSNFPSTPYLLDLQPSLRNGNTPILEIPMTIMTTVSHLLLKPFQNRRYQLLARRLMNRIWPPLVWLRPNGDNLRQMKWLVRKAIDESRNYIMFMLHSSELMPGGSQRFDTPEKIEKLFSDMKSLFSMIATTFEGATLSEYRDVVRLKNRELPKI